MLNYDQQSCVPFSNVTLTSAYTANRNVILSGGMSKLTVFLNYTRGGGEGASKMFMQLEGSDDGLNWYSLIIDTTGATSVITPREWEMTTTNRLNILVDIAYPFMRMSLRETGVVTNPGTATVAYTLSGL